MSQGEIMKSAAQERRGLPPEVLRACARRGLAPSRLVLVVNIARQTTALFEQAAGPPGAPRRYTLRKCFRCSTSKFGIGETAGSNSTPRGLHRLARKIGGGWPIGTVFTGRQAVGLTWKGRPDAAISHRILWLEGLEPGWNRGGNVDSFARYIYLHGVGNEPTLGKPASRGCIQLAAADLLPLFDRLPTGALVWITKSGNGRANPEAAS